MNISHVLGAGAALAAFGWFLTSSGTTSPNAAMPPMPPVADGHYVLVVEGDRTALAITAASAKVDPWAGVPKGFTSQWRLSIVDARGDTLAEVPLDVSQFATDAAAAGRGVRVAGCIVTSPHIGILVNVPAFANAAGYTFTRPGAADERIVLGTTTGDRVRELAGGGK